MLFGNPIIYDYAFGMQSSVIALADSGSQNTQTGETIFNCFQTSSELVLIF
jgi:hypothetical protein